MITATTVFDRVLKNVGDFVTPFLMLLVVFCFVACLFVIGVGFSKLLVWLFR